MKTFEYKGFDATGQARRGLIEAPGVKQAREKLAAEGILAERVSPTGRRARFAIGARARVYRELSALLEAGVPLVRALEMLIETHEMEDRHVTLAAIRDRIREGASLADALVQTSDEVSPLETAVVAAAERSAALDRMLERMADFLEEQDQLRQRVQSALIYPMIVTGVGICVAIVMMGVLVPRARALLADSGQALPALTRFVMGTGSVAVVMVPLLAVLTTAAAIWLRRMVRKDREVRGRWDRWRQGLPVAGRGIRLLASLRFVQTLAVLLRADVPLIEALVLAGEATGNAWIAELCVKEADAVRHGSSLSAAVDRIAPPLDVSLPGWIRVGETAGALPRLLEGSAKRLNNEWNRFLQRCLALLEPVLILLIGSFVLIVTLAVLLPVISLTQVVGR